MPGWSSQKRDRVEIAFRQFLSKCAVDSKDYGRIYLGDNLYWGQNHAITQIFDALEEDIHDVYFLKSRQLGISTIVRALTTFFLGIHTGLRGALVFDTAPNRDEARQELVSMIRNLPAALKFPKVRGTGEGNREGLTLENDSRILFKSAGVKKSKSSGTLGRSVGLAFATLSEICSYDNDEGMESFEQSLSDINPDRLYIRESTARGYNSWHTMWTEAEKDPLHKRCVFLGWWSKDSQRIDRSEPDFLRYGEQPPTDRELAKIKKVRDLYGFQVTQEQLAWYRRKMDPTAESEGAVPAEYEGSSTKIQEQPWVAEESFQNTGSQFFPSEKLNEQYNNFVSRKFDSFMFTTGSEFSHMQIHKSPNVKSTDLRVWEEPDPEGVYVFAVDPAFGEDENNDRAAIEVGRCFSDGVDQVAEFASPLVTPQQLAWVLASLMGWYGAGEKSECRYILELNGPGNAVFNEIKQLRFQLDHGYWPDAESQGIKAVFRNVRTFIYSRPDGMSAGANYHFKCLDVNELIPTPTGWTTMGQLAPGDMVFSEKGLPCRVTWASPIMHGHDCFEIQFEDGTSVTADADHLWPTNKGLRKTVELRAGEHSIALTAPLETADLELPIDPYVLGVWLGDGSSASGMFCGGEADFLELSEHLKARGATLGAAHQEKAPRQVWYRTILGLKERLRGYGLLGNKHIPAIYLRASFAQRLALLQGLMDTDGSIDINRQCGFNTTIPQLAEAFSELLTTLGIRPKYFIKKPYLVYAGKTADCQPCYQFWFTAYNDFPLFKLERKVSRQATPTYVGGKGGKGGLRPKRSRVNRIFDVRPVGSVPVRCIHVDSSSHLYLAGLGMVPTHNTNLQLKIMIMNHIRDYITTQLFRVRSAELLEECRSVTQEGDVIKSPGNKKDDRVLASAMLLYYWQNIIRKNLIATNRTRKAEEARRSVLLSDRVALFHQNQLQMMFEVKQKQRAVQASRTARLSWRYGRR